MIISFLENKTMTTKLINFQAYTGIFYFSLIMTILTKKKNKLANFFKYRDINI